MCITIFVILFMFIFTGLVRGIDPESKFFYIVTPMSINQLAKVNTLLKGALNLPKEFLVQQVCVVMYGSSTGEVF